MYSVLSLDGGGVRGLITAIWLDKLEREIGGPIGKYFDMVAGTSTGGILAAAVSSGMPANQIIKLYMEKGGDIFPSAASRRWDRFSRVLLQGVSAPKYSDAGLERELKRAFGDATFGSLHIKPTLITTYNTISREAMVFKNNKAEHKSIPVWKIAKATSSAPTYFPATAINIGGVVHSLIDGGVVANNPSACALAEAVKVLKDGKVANPLNKILFVSMGTGQSTRPITLKEAKEWGALEWAVPVIDVLMDGAADATEYIMAQLLPETRYFRMQTRLEAAYDDMDKADPVNLNALANMALHYLDKEGGNRQIAAIVRQLTSKSR